MTYNKCPQPEDSLLAKNGPIENIVTFLPTITKHDDYWSGKMAVASETMDFGLGTASESMHRELAHSTAYLTVPVELALDPEIVERDRQRALMALGVSIVLRRIMKPGMKYQDGVGLRKVDRVNHLVLVDMMADLEGMPDDYRIHLREHDATELLGEWPEGESDVWYERGPLYVNRLRPAEPSFRFLDQQAGRLVVNYDNLETIVPYVADIPKI